MLVITRMRILICYKIIMGPMRFFCPGPIVCLSRPWGYPHYFPITYRKYSNFNWGIPLKLARKSLSSKMSEQYFRKYC